MHKRECRIFKKLAPSVLPASVRAVLHIVFRATSTEEADQEELGYLHQLICHLEEIECGGDEDLEKIEMTTRAIKRYSSTKMPEKDILKYAALVRCCFFHAFFSGGAGSPSNRCAYCE